MGWVKPFQDPVEQLRELLNFVGIASTTQWQRILAAKKAAYRKSSVFQSYPAAVAAWLRRGEIVAQEIDCDPFDKGRFCEKLRLIRSVTLHENTDVFVPEVERLAASAGVVIAFVQELPGIRISGAARWLSSAKALIQLTLRYKTNDHLWFSLFHEAGHILLDGKREAFLDEKRVAGKSSMDEKESRADRFARDMLVQPDRVSSIKHQITSHGARATK